MVDWECEHCGLRSSDLPDGVDSDDYYEVMYGKEYCNGCMQGYYDGLWLQELDSEDPTSWFDEFDEDKVE